MNHYIDDLDKDPDDYAENLENTPPWRIDS